MHGCVHLHTEHIMKVFRPFCSQKLPLEASVTRCHVRGGLDSEVVDLLLLSDDWKKFAAWHGRIPVIC